MYFYWHMPWKNLIKTSLPKAKAAGYLPYDTDPWRYLIKDIKKIFPERQEQIESEWRNESVDASSIDSGGTLNIKDSLSFELFVPLYIEDFSNRVFITQLMKDYLILRPQDTFRMSIGCSRIAMGKVDRIAVKDSDCRALIGDTNVFVSRRVLNDLEGSARIGIAYLDPQGESAMRVQEAYAYAQTLFLRDSGMKMTFLQLPIEEGEMWCYALAEIEDKPAGKFIARALLEFGIIAGIEVHSAQTAAATSSLYGFVYTVESKLASPG